MLDDLVSERASSIPPRSAPLELMAHAMDVRVICVDTKEPVLAIRLPGQSADAPPSVLVRLEALPSSVDGLHLANFIAARLKDGAHSDGTPSTT